MSVRSISLNCGIVLKRVAARIAADQTGATAIEYGLLASLIAIAATQALAALGGELNVTFNTVTANMNTSANGGGADQPPPPAPDPIEQG